MMPITSYTSVGMPANTPPCSMPNTMFAPGMLAPPGQPQQLQSGPGPQQPQVPQQQQFVFSGASGNFFLAQSPTVGGPPMGTPLMLAPGQGNPGGTFMVAQPVPPSAVPGTPMATSAPPNCIIRLPDGRLVMPATAPTPVGFTPSTISRLPGAPAAYYSVPMTGGTPGTVNPSQQPTAGLVNPNTGQTFFIQVPSNPASGFGGTMITTTSTASSMSFQPPSQQSTGLLKPTQAISCVGSPQFSARHPVLMSVAVSSPQPPCIMSPKTSGAPSPNVMSTTANQPGNPSLVQCTTPTPMDAQLTSNLQPLAPSGMGVARLPNGTYTTLAYSRPQTPSNIQGICTTPSGNGSLPSATPPEAGSGSVQRKTSTSSRPGTRPQLPAAPSIADSGEVLRRLDEQIALHQNTPNPTDLQSTKLKQLIEARNQLAKTMAATGNAQVGDVLATPNSLVTGTLRQPRPQALTISPSLRRELLNMLAKNNLLPAAVNPTSAETFVVEFRLNNQQYRLRLTRAQKADMERLLYSVRSQRQAEILTVLQQEQSRFLAPRPRIVVTSTTASTSATNPGLLVSPSPSANVAGTLNSAPVFGSTAQPMRLHSPIQSFAPNQPTTLNMQPHAFSQSAAPGLRLVATRPLLQPTAGVTTPVMRGVVTPTAPGICTPTGTPTGTNNPVTVSTAPVMGVVTALAMPPMTSQGPGAQMFASNLGSTGTATVVPHTVPTIPVSGPSVVPGAMGVNTTGATAPGLFISSFPPSMSGSQTFVMQQSVMVSSSTGPVPLPSNCTLVQQSPAPTQQTALQPILQPGNAQKVAPIVSQLQQNQLQQPQLTVPQPIRTPTPIQASASPPVRAVIGLSAQQAARLSRMKAFLSHDLKASVTKPPSDETNTEKLPLATDLLQTMASYHVLRDADNTVEALDKVERILDTSIALLFERKRQTIRAVDALLFRQTMEQLQPCVEDQLILAQMALDLDRDILASEKQDFADALAGGTETTQVNLNGNVADEVDQSEITQEPKTTYLRHTTSVLPPTWQSMLGPLAFLRPLTFDANGHATYASIDLPVTADHSQLQTDETTHSSITHANGPTGTELSSDADKNIAEHSTPGITPAGRDQSERSDEDEDDVDAMSDDVEADLLLGLDTRQSRGSVSSDSIAVANGNYTGIPGGEQRGGSILGVGKRGRDKCVAFEETYNLWQELMREEGMDMDMEGENGDDAGGIGADTLDASLDSTPGSMLQEDSSRNSLRTLDNRPGGMAAGMQHSEDPDIDAAIRSILSTTN